MSNETASEAVDVMVVERWNEISARDIAELLGDSAFRVYRSEIFNVGNGSASQWENMLNAGMAAARAIRQAGEGNFKVKIDVGGVATGSRGQMEQVAAKAYQRFMAIANDCAKRRKPVKELSNEESFSICVAARVQLVTETGQKLVLKTETANRCCIVLEGDGYSVYQLAR